MSSSNDDDHIENDYVLLSNELEPDNDLYTLSELCQPLDEPLSRFVQVATFASCLAPTDLKARLRTLPSIIETFHRAFERLKSEARFDPDRVQNEIFELYSNFFALVRSILDKTDAMQTILRSSMTKFEAILGVDVETGTVLVDLHKNGVEFKALFDDDSSQDRAKWAKCKIE